MPHQTTESELRQRNGNGYRVNGLLRTEIELWPAYNGSESSWCLSNTIHTVCADWAITDMPNEQRDASNKQHEDDEYAV